MLGDDLTNKDVVMTENSVDAPPRPFPKSSSCLPPKCSQDGDYRNCDPEVARDRRWRGEEYSRPTSSPLGVFDEAALNAVRRWMFSPATYQGQPYP